MAPEQRFRDRFDAGKILASWLTAFMGRAGVLTLALPRGGVPVGFEVARSLGVPLDVFIVRKLGVPGNEELAMGAIASGGMRVENAEVLRSRNISRQTVEQVAQQEQGEVKRREREYRGDRPPLEIRDRTVILVDDGMATGATMGAGIAALRRLGAAQVIVAIPVGAPQACRDMRALADKTVCVRKPENFVAISQWYDDFRQTSDEDVRNLLQRSVMQSAEEDETIHSVQI